MEGGDTELLFLRRPSDLEYEIVGPFFLPSVPPITGDRPGDLERGRLLLPLAGEFLFLLSNLEGSRCRRAAH